MSKSDGLELNVGIGEVVSARRLLMSTKKLTARPAKFSTRATSFIAVTVVSVAFLLTACTDGGTGTGGGGGGGTIVGPTGPGGGGSSFSDFWGFFRNFPTGYCPVETRASVGGGNNLTFTPDSSSVRFTFMAKLFEDGFFTDQAIDNFVVLEPAVFEANNFLPAESCYEEPGTEEAPAFDLAAAGQALFVDTFDSNATRWVLTNASFTPDGQSGGGIQFGSVNTGAETASASIVVEGFKPDTPYMVFFWWRVDTNGPILEIELEGL